MHEGELALDEPRAARLISQHFPELSGLPLRPVSTVGTVNRIIRVGEELVARFPLLGASADGLGSEAESLSELAAVCPFPAPRPYGIAPPCEDFDSAWSVQTWIDGVPADPDSAASSAPFARDIVRLIAALRAAPTRGRRFDGIGRGGRLADHDDWVAECLARSGHLFDTPRAAALWRGMRSRPASGSDTMSHRDLTPFNLLIDNRDDATRLVGILDAGAFGPADPALDLVAAWHLFDAPARRLLREGLAADENEWLRGAGWALQQALGLGWYYADSNPAMSALGLSTVQRLLTDSELSECFD